jgi:putative transcriptional regulator
MNYNGKLIIAPPSIRGNFWQKSVIFITENHFKGSMGVLLNRNSKNTIKDFGTQVGFSCNIPGYVYIGGPVSTKALTILHSSEWRCENTLEINNDFSLSSHGEILQRLNDGDLPKYWRLFLGLCAWNPKQLENEVFGNHPYNHENSWLIATPTYHNVFELDSTEQWTYAIDKSSSEFVQKLLD